MNVNKLVKLLGLGVVVGTACWLFWSWLHAQDYANLPPAAAGPWVAFGDSLTEGYGASEGHDYPTLLGQKAGVKILNLGRSGETSADGLKRLADVTQLHPRVVLLCFGGNDALERSSRAQMFSHVGEIIDGLKQEGAFVVLIGIRSASLRDQNEQGFRQLAREKQVFYVPNILKGIFPRPVYMADAIHPNDEGYRLIAERLEKELRPFLQKLRTTNEHQ